MATSAPNLVIPVGPQPTQLIASYAVVNAAPAGTVYTATITAFGPSLGGVQSVPVPISEVWHWYRVSIVGTPTTDAVLTTSINGVPQVIYPTLSSLNEANLSPFAMTQTIPIPPGSSFGSTITLLAAAGSSYTQVLKYWVVRAPYTGGAA